MSQYRDPLAGLRSQIATRRVRVEELSRAIRPVSWALATPAERREIAELRAGAAAEPTDLATASAIDARLVALESALEGLVSAAQWFARDTGEAPPVSYPGGKPEAWLTDDAISAFWDTLDARVAALLGAPRLLVWGEGYRARGWLGVVPVQFATRPFALGAFSSSLRIRIVQRCDLVMAGREVLRADRVGARVATGRTAQAMRALEDRDAQLRILRSAAKITWKSTPREQERDAIPWEAIAALASVYVAARRMEP